MDEQLNDLEGYVPSAIEYSEDGTPRTGIRYSDRFRTGIPLQQGVADTPTDGGLGNALNGIDLTNLLQQTGVQSQPQVTDEGPTPLDDFLDGVGAVVDQATNFNQGGLGSEYKQNIGMPNYLSQAAEMYAKDNEQLAKAFGLYGGVTGGITDADVAVKLEKLPTEVYNQLQRNYADLLRQDAAKRMAEQPYDYNQFNPLSESFDPLGALANTNPITGSIDRGLKNAAAGLVGLGAGATGLASKAIGSLIPGQDAFDTFGDAAFELSGKAYHDSGKKYVDVRTSIIEDNPQNMWNPNNFSTTVFNAISMGTEVAALALIPFMKAGTAVGASAAAKFGANQALAAMAANVAKTGKVANLGVAKAFREALAKATIADIKTGGLFLPGVGIQLTYSQVVASLQSGARALATAMVISPGALFATYQKSNGDIPNVFNAFQEGGNEELRKTDFLSVAERVGQDFLGEGVIGFGLGVLADSVKAVGKKIVSEGVNLEELKKVLPTLPDSSAASKVIETMVQLRHNAVAQEVYKVADKFNIHTELPQSNVGKAFAKWANQEVKPPSTGTFNVGGQPGYHPQVTKLLKDYANVQKQLVEDLKTVKTAEEANQIIKQAEIEHAQIAEVAKAVISESNGEIKRIAKTRVPSKELSESIDNLVRTNNGGVAPASIEKANVASTVNMLIKQDTPSTNVAKLTEEIKTLKGRIKKAPPKNPKLLAQYAKDLETDKSLLKQKQAELKEQKNLQLAKSRSNLLTQIMNKQKEIQNIVEGTRLQVQEGTVKKNLAKAQKIIDAHNAEAMSITTPQAKTIQNGVSAAEYPAKLQEFEKAKKQFSIEHPKVPQELLDVNKTIEKRTSENRGKLYLTQEENDTIIQLEKEIADLQTKLPPTMQTKGKPSEPVVLSKEQVSRHLNDINWGIKNTEEVIAKLKQATSKDKEILVPDKEAINKAVSKFQQTDPQYLAAAKKASELYDESGEYFKTVLGLKYRNFSPNIWSLKDENLNTKKLAQILNTTETVVKELQLAIKEAWTSDNYNLRPYDKFSKLLEEWVEKQDIYKRFWTAADYRTQLSDAYRDSLKLPPKKVKFDARLEQLKKAEQELEQQLLKKKELENYKPTKAKTKKPSLLDGIEDFEPEVVDFTPYGGKEAVEEVKAAIETRKNFITAISSRSVNPNELTSFTTKREELITKYGTDKNISAPLGLDYNQPTIEFSIPSKDSVLKTIGTLKTKNQANKPNSLRGDLISRGDTSQPTPDVSVEVNNFNDLIAYLGKSLSGDVNTIPTSLSDDVYNNAVKQALIGDGIIGTMAKRTGKTKSEIYKTIRFEITPKQGAGTLIGGAFYGRVLPVINTLQMNSKNPSTTFLHELIHTFDTVGYFTKQEREVLGKWHGKPQGSDAAMEALSYGFQEYLDTGKGPTSKITKIFDQIKESLTEVLAPLLRHAQLFLQFGKDQPLKVTDEVADLFGKLIDDGSFKEAYSEFIKKKPQLIPDTPAPVKQVRKSLSKKLEEAGIPLKPAKKGLNTKNRLYQLTKEDVQLFDANYPDLSTLSIKDKRLLASEELNDLSPLQLKELNNELNRIYDDSDEGGLLGRKLSRLIPDDSIFRPEYTSDSGITTLLPEEMFNSLNKLESKYNELADIDLQLAQTIGISNDALNLQRTVIANQIADSVSKKMGGFELSPKKLVENYNKSLRESVPEEYQYLVPTPESQKAVAISGNKQRIVNRIQATDYYQSLPTAEKSAIQLKFRGKASTPADAQKFLDDILSGKIKEKPNGKTTTVKTEKADETKPTKSETDTKTDETVNATTQDSSLLDGNEYYTAEQVAVAVENLSGGADVIPTRANIDAIIKDIIEKSTKAGLDYESTIHIVSQFFEDVNKQMNTTTNFGTYETPNALSRGTISRTAERLGINPNSLIHYINQNVVEDGLQKVYKAEAVAAMANHFDNMLKEAVDVVGKADDAEFLQRPYNTFPISGNGGTKAKPGLSPTDNLLDVISKIELFTKVVTPDLQKMVEASGLYVADLYPLVKDLQEAKKANALLHDFTPEVAQIDGLLAKAESPSADSITGGVPDDKASVLEDMYKKEEYQSEELVHTHVLKTLVDPKKLAYQQDTFAQLKNTLQEFNSIRRQYVNPLRLQLGLGPGKAIESAMKAGLNVTMDAVTAITIGNMVYSTRVFALQFVGGPMGTLYNAQKYAGGIFNTSLANYAYNKTGSNIYRNAGHVQAGAALEAWSEIQASLGDYRSLGGMWYNIVSSFDTLWQATKWIPKGGHPMTARHSGELEPMFKAAAKQFQEGSLGSTAFNTMGRFLGTTQKAVATPISFLDSIMTIHTAKVKSRAAVLREVLLSKEYREMNFTPGSKESSKYLKSKVDEVMPRNYFVWNKATTAAAQESTLTTPLPDVSVNSAWNTIKNEGVARTAFGLIDHYSNWLGTAAPPLRPYVALFSRVSGNYLNQAFGGTFLSKDGMQLTRTALDFGTFKATPYFENYFSKMADNDTYEAMAYATGALGGGMIGLLAGWWFIESFDNNKDDFPFIKLLQRSTGAAFNPVTMGYDTTTQIRVDNPTPFGPDGVTINLNQIPALHFILPAVNFYREYTSIMDNHSKQLNENVDTSGNVIAALEADKQAQIGRAMGDYFQAVFPIDAASMNIADTGKDIVKATLNLHQQATDLHKTLVDNKGNELLYDPWTTLGVGMMPQIVQELFYNSLVTKLIPQLNEIPIINLKADTHSAKDLKIYASAGLLRTGTAMETMMKFPAVYTFLGQPRISTQSAFVSQKPGPTTDPGMQELDRLNKRYPLSKLADNLVFNLHPMGGGSVQPSHTVWGGIKGINGSHIVAASLRNYRLGNNSDPRSALYPYNGKTLPQALRILINSEAYRNAPDAYLDDKKVLGNPDESMERESKVTMIKTLFNVYHERINDLLSSDPSLFVIDSSNSKGTNLVPITEIEQNLDVDNRPKGFNQVQPVPQQQIDQFTKDLINNTQKSFGGF